MKITEYIHHGQKVKVQSELKGRHREHCLCFLGCKYFHPDDREENCVIANNVFENCKKYGIVTPVWECPYYETEKSKSVTGKEAAEALRETFQKDGIVLNFNEIIENQK